MTQSSRMKALTLLIPAMYDLIAIKQGIWFLIYVYFLRQDVRKIESGSFDCLRKFTVLHFKSRWWLFTLTFPYLTKRVRLGVFVISPYFLRPSKQTNKKHCRPKHGAVMHVLDRLSDFLEQTLSYIHHRYNIPRLQHYMYIAFQLSS